MVGGLRGKIVLSQRLEVARKGSVALRSLNPPCVSCLREVAGITVSTYSVFCDINDCDTNE